jgi:hypothetical protein
MENQKGQIFLLPFLVRENESFEKRLFSVLIIRIIGILIKDIKRYLYII